MVLTIHWLELMFLLFGLLATIQFLSAQYLLEYYLSQ